MRHSWLWTDFDIFVGFSADVTLQNGCEAETDGYSSDSPNAHPLSEGRQKTARKYEDADLEIDIEQLRRQENIDAASMKVAKLAHPTSRSVLNDVRRYYARMFMNCVNSGDLPQVESYFNTFMSGPCNFVLKHNINPLFGIPPHLAAQGPRLFSHYLLGCFLTFPDMVLKLGSSNIITSKGWNGTKIVMETDVYCTKIYDLSEDFSWLPEVDQLSDIYQNLSISDKSNPSTPRGDASIKKEGKREDSTALQLQPQSAGRSPPPSRIPTTYVEALIDRARLLRVPQHLNSRGHITLFLDENHCMQHVVVDLVQMSHTSCSQQGTV